MTSDRISRRTLLAGGPVFAAALGVPIPFLRFLPEGVAPVALAAPTNEHGLSVLNEHPLNIETPAHLLDDRVTPASRFFVRNNGLPPDLTDIVADDWELTIDGEVETPLTLSVGDLKRDFEPVTLSLQIECGGNGRRYFSPGASGNQWSFGAIACAEWTGVRLAEVLEKASVKPTAVYTGHYGADRHLSGDPDKAPISRGVPIKKAFEPHTILAWAMNGADIPFANGHPLRLIAPGWPGSCSQKWLTRIWVRDQIHDGAKMMGQSHRVPAYPVAPGAEVPDEDMVIIESMPVKSLITFPETGVRRVPQTQFRVHGHAWAGDRRVDAMHVSIDFGRTWQKASLDPPANKYAWQQWRADVSLPQAGYFEVWARATDEAGEMQPPIAPGWNPRGYLNNMQHRIAVFAV
ncbi:MAG: sulfite oxidase [Pseudomonadota bacterium]